MNVFHFALNFRVVVGLLFGGGCLFLASPVEVCAEDDSDLRRIKYQIAEQLVSTPAAKDPRFMTTAKEQGVEEWMHTLSPAGNWADITYDDKTAGAWSPILHLARVVEMTKAYGLQSHKLHQRPELRAAIRSAMAYWFEKDFRSPNWFHNEIRVPQYMAHILIMLDSDASAGEREKALKIIARSSIKMTGQNKVWLAGNVLMRGVLEGNAALVQTARDTINANISVTTEEGLQADNSFHQHGAQLQSGGYGLSFAVDSVAWLEALRGTRMALSDDKLALLRDFVLRGTNLTVWNGMMDISLCGRQLFRGAQASKGALVEKVLVALQKSDPAFAPDYEKALRSYRGAVAPGDQVTGNMIFWRSDFMMDRRPGYYASVKMSSPRVIGTEFVNKENASGGLLGEGALYLYKTGKEYEDIFPVWDWHRLPGVTCMQKVRLLPGRDRNLSRFVGGVTDGRDGAAVMDFDREVSVNRIKGRMVAKKSWFFFDGQIVCLGTGISTEMDEVTTTSVNQCWLNGPVIASVDGKAAPVLPGHREYTALKWAWHDGVGYVFPQPANIMVGGAEQKGAWTKVYDAGSPDPVVKDVFSIWIDHGRKPQGASYAYVLLPAVSEAQVRAYADKPGARILNNTALLQAVQYGEVTTAVFYQPGRLQYAPGKEISVSQPCLVMITETSAGPALTVADPSQDLKELGIDWNGRTLAVPLPSGPQAGRSVAAGQVKAGG